MITLDLNKEGVVYGAQYDWAYGSGFSELKQYESFQSAEEAGCDFAARVTIWQPMWQVKEIIKSFAGVMETIQHNELDGSDVVYFDGETRQKITYDRGKEKHFLIEWDRHGRREITPQLAGRISKKWGY